MAPRCRLRAAGLYLRAVENRLIQEGVIDLVAERRGVGEVHGEALGERSLAPPHVLASCGEVRFGASGCNAGARGEGDDGLSLREWVEHEEVERARVLSFGCASCEGRCGENVAACDASALAA